MAKVLNTIIVVAIFFIVSACNNKEDKQVFKSCENVVLSLKEVKKDSVYVINNNDKASIRMSASLLYPMRASNNIALQKIRKIFTNSFFKSDKTEPNEIIEDWMSDLINQSKNDVILFSAEQEMPTEFYFSVQQSIMDSTNLTITLSNLVSSFEGGAHGMDYVTNINIEKNTGKIITEDDIFKNDDEFDLINALEMQLMKDNNVSSIKELEEIGFISTEEIKPNGNFSISEDGITYIFNHYEIACYAVGIVKVKLSYDNIKSFLKDDFRRKFLNN